LNAVTSNLILWTLKINLQIYLYKNVTERSILFYS